MARSPASPRVRASVPASVGKILARIGALGAARGLEAYAVGGCVRDWCLTDAGIAVRGPRGLRDLDVTVHPAGRSEQADGPWRRGLELAAASAEDLQAPVEIHAQFGTATVLVGGARVDFASCRRERYTDVAAYPQVSPGTLADDLRRRDFTINAMALALHPDRFGLMADPFGGFRDLRGRWLRILHAASFRDDPSRILRGVRFAARFGLRWAPATRRALDGALRAGWLGRLNAGRIQREILRMAEEPRPRACYRALAELLAAPR
ncbi:MAG TPA: hypothetical protein VGB20_01220 [bacterium]